MYLHNKVSPVLPRCNERLVSFWINNSQNTLVIPMSRRLDNKGNKQKMEQHGATCIFELSPNKRKAPFPSQFSEKPPWPRHFDILYKFARRCISTSVPLSFAGFGVEFMCAWSKTTWFCLGSKRHVEFECISKFFFFGMKWVKMPCLSCCWRKTEDVKQEGAEKQSTSG